MTDSPTQCEKCGEQRATVHLTEIEDGKPKEHHYCEQCYASQSESYQTGTAFNRLLAAVAPALAEMSSHQCPVCGINYLVFRHSFRLGCQHDYEAFEQPLEALLDEIHGDTRHCGKVPPGVGRQEALRQRLTSLQKRLEIAIAEENYEHAATLRDRIGKIREDGIDEPAT
jgi:protein arginine kinase activator